MPTSINGYPVLSGWGDNRLKKFTVPGTRKSVWLRADIAPVILAFLSEVDKTVLDLDKGPLDGFVRRPSRYNTRWSNHASGTAIDFRYDVLKADRRRHMTRIQTRQMQALLNKYVVKTGLRKKRLFIWGGDWRAVDEMHLEIALGVSVSDVKKAMEQLGIRADGTFKKTPSPVGQPKPNPNLPLVSLANVKPGKVSADVKVVQKALVKEGLLPTGSVTTKPVALFGPRTKEAYAKWQRRCGYTGADADGVPGATTLKLLGNKHGFRVVK